VRDLCRRLEQQQALVRGGRKDTPAAGLPRDGGVIEGDIEAEQRQLKPILPAGLAMTAAGIASQATQQRHHLGAEIDRPAIPEAGDVHRHLEVFAAAFDPYYRRSVALRGDVPLAIDASHLRIAARVDRLAGNVLAFLRDEQLPAGEGVGEGEGLWGAGQLRPSRCQNVAASGTTGGGGWAFSLQPYPTTARDAILRCGIVELQPARREPLATLHLLQHFKGR